MEEIWKDIEDYCDEFQVYQVSNFGRVRKFSHTPIATNGGASRYIAVSLALPASRRGTQKLPFDAVPVHVTVAKYFISDRPLGMVINHKDGNKHNNRLDNLEYVTPKENTNHAIRIGLTKSVAGSNNPGVQFKHRLPRGSKSHKAKLTEAQVLEIRAKYNGTTIGYRTLAKEYGVSHPSIASIVKRKGWSHIA